MKKRLGHVSNSSSTSFVIKKKDAFVETAAEVAGEHFGGRYKDFKVVQLKNVAKAFLNAASGQDFAGSEYVEKAIKEVDEHDDPRYMIVQLSGVWYSFEIMDFDGGVIVYTTRNVEWDVATQQLERAGYEIEYTGEEMDGYDHLSSYHNSNNNKGKLQYSSLDALSVPEDKRLLVGEFK